MTGTHQSKSGEIICHRCWKIYLYSHMQLRQAYARVIHLKIGQVICILFWIMMELGLYRFRMIWSYKYHRYYILIFYIYHNILDYVNKTIYNQQSFHFCKCFWQYCSMLWTRLPGQKTRKLATKKITKSNWP